MRGRAFNGALGARPGCVQSRADGSLLRGLAMSYSQRLPPSPTLTQPCLVLSCEWHRSAGLAHLRSAGGLPFGPAPSSRAATGTGTGLTTPAARMSPVDLGPACTLAKLQRAPTGVEFAPFSHPSPTLPPGQHHFVPFRAP